MIRLIEALNYRCLRYVRQELGPFHVLVGPNASGKTTFLDVIAFLGDLVQDGPEYAISKRTPDFRDLTWNRVEESFELAIELSIPADRRELLPEPYDIIRYEVAIGSDPKTDIIGILQEKALLKYWKPLRAQQRTFFPIEPEVPRTIMSPARTRRTKSILAKVVNGNDNYYLEAKEKATGGWTPSIKLGPHRSTLGMLFEDESLFPVSTWMKRLLTHSVQNLVLNSQVIRKASPAGKGRDLMPDGSNLPWVVSDFRERAPQKFRDWIAHLQTSIPDLIDIECIVREDDRHSYLVLCYRDGLKVRSWMVSDGTLRLLALTLPAYLPDLEAIFLIEEPENGIHPRAVETLFESLSSVYEAQVLLASHSPVVLGLASPEQILCFKKTDNGSTDIVRGNQHPRLQEWKCDSDLGSLFVAGVLG